VRVALAIVTIERPHAVARLVRSARRLWPDMRIYVADQSANIDAMNDFYFSQRVNVVRMPFDAGLAASRNALVNAADEEFLLLCDDDFVLGAETGIEQAIAVLDAAADIAVVGGRLHDLDERGERVRNWEMFFHYDPRHRTFTAIPIYNYTPVARTFAGINVFMCDAVLNFCVFRRSIFCDGVRWDDAIKINGEHEDFYLNLKLNTDWKVGYLPSLAALHSPTVAAGRYRSRLRGRQTGWEYFRTKWNIEQHVEIGTGVRPVSGLVRDWFSDRGEKNTSQGVSALESGVASLQLRHTPDARKDFQPGSCTRSEPVRSLVEAPHISAYRPDYHRLLLRYSADLDESGLVLWCRFAECGSSADRFTEGQSWIALRMRWTDSSGQTLVWESPRIVIEVQQDAWIPCIATVPVWPERARHLQFDVLAERGDDRIPVMNGLVSRPERESEGQSVADAFGRQIDDVNAFASQHGDRMLLQVITKR
jgi:GT2 family glycosyltransferase